MTSDSKISPNGIMKLLMLKRVMANADLVCRPLNIINTQSICGCTHISILHFMYFPKYMCLHNAKHMCINKDLNVIVRT